MIVSQIVAVSANGVIGSDGKLPWHLPDDMAYFRQMTEGKPVIMGRKTFESIGRLLPNRTNIVLTKKPASNVQLPRLHIAHSMEEAIEMAKKENPQEVMIIGGAEVYKQSLAKTNRVYLTLVHTELDGDAFYPQLSSVSWREVSRKQHPADDRHAYAFDFIVYEKRILIA